jgi:hypothetical protein
MMGWKPRLSSRAIVVGAVSVLALCVLVPAAFATTVNYFGYANLTASNPPANSCGTPSQAGLACSGWANWDYSEADWVSGHSDWYLGFLCQKTGSVNGRWIHTWEDFRTYDEYWSNDCPDGHYNRAAVLHLNNTNGSYDYLQGRALS